MEAPGPADDQADDGVDAFVSAVADPPVQGGGDAVEVLADRLGGLGELVQSRLLRSPAPALDQADGVAGSQVAVEDRPEGLLQLVAGPDASAAASELAQPRGLAVVEVFGVLQQCPSGSLEQLRRVRVDLLLLGALPTTEGADQPAQESHARYPLEQFSSKHVFAYRAGFPGMLRLSAIASPWWSDTSRSKHCAMAGRSRASPASQRPDRRTWTTPCAVRPRRYGVDHRHRRRYRAYRLAFRDAVRRRAGAHDHCRLWCRNGD